MDNYTLEGRLREAIYIGDLAGVQKLIGQGADIHAKDQHGLTPLHSAVTGNALAIAGLLIEQGADINARNEKMDMTPLHLAAFNGAVQMVALLLSHKVRTDIANDAGETAQQIARNMGHGEIAVMLEPAAAISPATAYPAYCIA